MEESKNRFVQPTLHINMRDTKVPNRVLQPGDPDPQFRAIP